MTDHIAIVSMAKAKADTKPRAKPAAGKRSTANAVATKARAASRAAPEKKAPATPKQASASKAAAAGLCRC